MVKHIFLRQVVELMKMTDEKGNAIPFDIEVRTFNKNNSTGGSYRIYKGAKLLIGKKLKGKKFIEADHFFRIDKVRKRPEHWRNATRNIELKTGQIVKVKIRYIIKFNGLEMAY